MRSTAKAGMTTEPPRPIVRRIASAMTWCSASTSGWARSPYVDSMTTVLAAGGRARGRSTGWSGPPEVAGEEHARAVELDEHARGAEDVPGPHEGHLGSGARPHAYRLAGEAGTASCGSGPGGLAAAGASQGRDGHVGVGDV